MRIAITGEEGFIAKNLIKEINSSQDNTFVSLKNNKCFKYFNFKGEPCVHSNAKSAWVNAIKSQSIDVLVHNAAVVGTDVVALDVKEAIMTNILGTQIITEAVNECGILNVFLGTTVIYDTKRYQYSSIKEDSEICPRTLYANQKYSAEMIVKNTAKRWLVIRPLFAYGGIGDPNSLIAKTIFAVKNKIKIPMFLNPDNVKDYLHVENFCDGVMQTIRSGIENEDFNISAENPYKTGEIVEFILNKLKCDDIDIIKWHPETDYLGNHLLSCDKFRKKIGFSKKLISIHEGIDIAIKEIYNCEEKDYNPITFIQAAKESNINLLDFFPK